MAPVIWGLDLAEIRWSKFQSSYMWNNAYHLRRTRFIVYQCALIFCVFSESLGTATITKYIDQQDRIKRLNPDAYEYNNDYVGVMSFNVFAGVFVATIFGAAFFFDLFWPERHESRSVRLWWKITAAACVVLYLANAIAITTIVTTHKAYIADVGATSANELAAQTKGHSPLLYRSNARSIAALVFAWLGWVSVVGSAIVLFICNDHLDKYGPLSRREKARRHGLTKEGGDDSLDVDRASMDEMGQHRHDGYIGGQGTDGAYANMVDVQLQGPLERPGPQVRTYTGT